MGSLTRDHWLALLTSVAEVHGARRLADFPHVALRAIARIVPYDMASFNTVDQLRRRIHPVAEPVAAVASPVVVETLAAHMHEHPLLAHHHSSGATGAVRLSDIVTRRQFRDSALYHEFYRPLAIECQMTAALALGPQASVGIALSRCTTDFSEQEREILEIFRPNLAQAHAALLATERGLRTVSSRGPDARRTEPFPPPKAALGSARCALTSRETEIMELLAAGASNAEIADVLHISALTVKKHLEHVYHKLGVHRRGAAVARYRA